MIDGQAQSVTPVTIAGSDIAGVDFGFNFDTIVNTNDAGQGSLRQFILNSNLLTDIPAQSLNAGKETSIFMIANGSGYPGTGAHGTLDLTIGGLATIAPVQGLPAVTDANTALDAGTQNGASCAPARNLRIMLDGTGVPASGGTNPPGLELNGPDALLRGWAIGNFSGNGVSIAANGDAAVVLCNHIGLNAAGNAANANHIGLSVLDADDVVIGDNTAAGRNVVSANNNNGILFDGTYANAGVAGNTIGLDADGNGDLGNTMDGVTFWGAATGITVRGNTISGNGQDGLQLGKVGTAGMLSTGALIENNIIGLNAAGTTAVANEARGLYIQDSDNALVQNNTISGNTGVGVILYGLTDGVTLTGNRVGVALGSLDAVGNGGDGISLTGATHTLIGGASGGNIIANNGGDGVSGTATGTGNSVSMNTIYSNTGLGIDLNADDVTLNDANDSDTGANSLLNFPQFNTALLGSNLRIAGCAPTGSSIELFEADVSPTSASGVSAGANQFGRTQDYGEGERYLLTLTEGVDEDTVTTPVDCATLTDADGNSAEGMSPFQWTIPLPADVVVDDLLTATATLNTLGTSEFSPATPLVTIQDYGDAPASYGSPLHTIVSGTHLGLNAPDMETAAAPPLDGSGDDVTGIDDEDGVSMYGFPLDNALINEGTQTLTVDTTGNGYLSAWVDFNRNGDFADAGEQIATNIHSSGGTLYLDFTPPAGMQTGDSYARFRYSSVTGLGPDGNAQPCPTEHE
ncbi:MAG: right-handed parallel beta-helix repeat-containing protein, partial [Thiothrix sp.]|nr:right-handed parallel beta-helix repeat-containing protein [Thiothrix sp.]